MKHQVTLTINNMLRMFPTALDQWAMLAVGLHVFGKDIPWYLWAIMAAEGVIMIKICVQRLKEKK